MIERMAWGFFAGVFAFGAFAADPAISQVTVRQRWPWSKLVDIDYLLTAEVGQKMDISLTAYDGQTELTIPAGSLTGDLYDVGPGPRRIVWDPTVTAYTNNEALTQFNVALAVSTPPLYMIVDLTKAAGATGQIEYVYEADLTNGLWGAWVRNPVTNSGTVVESVIWTGVTTNDVYKTNKLVLRRVHAGTFGFGPSAISTTLTKGYYAGVFEVTEAQWDKIMNGSSTSTKPKNNIPYNVLRGAISDVPSVNWPTTKSVVTFASFAGQIRSKTGLTTFDLPTCAQWEYLCRAGTTSYFYDGVSVSATDTNILNRLAWWTGNGSVSHIVGEKEPNAWGFYDTLGNELESCLDWSGGVITGVSDPAGPTTGTLRQLRGGCYGSPTADYCSVTATGNAAAPDSGSGYRGFRLVLTLPY